MANRLDGPYKHAHISGAATTLVFTGRCTLVGVTVNAAPTTATVYDGIDATGAVSAAIGAAPAGSHLPYAISHAVGLTIVTVGAGTDLTVTYLPALN